jgi:elongation factor Ts
MVLFQHFQEFLLADDLYAEALGFIQLTSGVFSGDDEAAARGVAMQIAAMRPRYLTREDVPAELVDKEREIAEATAREEGKPEQALPKIIEGRLNGFFKENVLLEQSSVQDSKKTVKALLDDAGVTIARFAHIEIGA